MVSRNPLILTSCVMEVLIHEGIGHITESVARIWTNLRVINSHEVCQVFALVVEDRILRDLAS